MSSPTRCVRLMHDGLDATKPLFASFSPLTASLGFEGAVGNVTAAPSANWGVAVVVSSYERGEKNAHFHRIDFDSDRDEPFFMAFERDRVKERAAALAAKGVYVGTSSWKYEGWLGQLYTPSKYEKVSKKSGAIPQDEMFPQLLVETQPAKQPKIDDKRFEHECLTEYAEVFKTVSVDATYYKFPTASSLESLAAQVPSDFRFGIKVTGDVTIKHFGFQPRYGLRAGKPNENFLNADLFNRAFLESCASIRSNVGVIMFEFSRFSPSDFRHVHDFLAVLDPFFGQLPRGWPYAIELRNKTWLEPEYFACLARHGVTHVFNSWEAMPPVVDQMALGGSRTNQRLVAARFLLKPGRKYEEAVTAFQPYDKVKEPYPDARAAGAALIAEGRQSPDRDYFIYVNNRLEGNALETIDEMLERVTAQEAAGTF